MHFFGTRQPSADSQIERYLSRFTEWLVASWWKQGYWKLIQSTIHAGLFRDIPVNLIRAFCKLKIRPFFENRSKFIWLSHSGTKIILNMYINILNLFLKINTINAIFRRNELTISNSVNFKYNSLFLLEHPQK